MNICFLPIPLQKRRASCKMLMNSFHRREACGLMPSRTDPFLLFKILFETFRHRGSSSHISCFNKVWPRKKKIRLYPFGLLKLKICLNMFLLIFFIVYLIFYAASGGVCFQSPRNCKDVLILQNQIQKTTRCQCNLTNKISPHWCLCHSVYAVFLSY